MHSLKTVARYVRSKNAGPFWVTIDIFCDTAAEYARIVAAPDLGDGAIARLYGVEESSVRRFAIEPLKVLKISFPRPIAQGSTGDADSHAGQYFVPLLDAPIP
jgi:hypothetical protein